MSVLVVLSLDHWHAGLAGFCGGEPLLMPRVDRLAAESAVFDRHFELLNVMGKSVIRVGEVGAGNVVKLANQIIVAANIEAIRRSLRSGSEGWC